jgi:hypothetical protein
MKGSSANPVKTLGGIDSYATSQDQFAAECYIRYNIDTIASHSAITGIADVALHYHTICSGCHIYQTGHFLKFIKPVRIVSLNLKDQGFLNLKKEYKVTDWQNISCRLILVFRPMIVFVVQYLKR